MLSQESAPCCRSAEAGLVSTRHKTAPQELCIRSATIADLNAIGPLRQLSARVLTGGHYAEADTDAALATGPLDMQMIRAGSFFVGILGERLVGTAAWSPSPDASGAAVVRSVYVHPDAAGMGVGQKLMGFVERHAVDAGCNRFELQSSLSAVGFYRRLCYQVEGHRSVKLNNHVELPIVQMHKSGVDPVVSTD